MWATMQMNSTLPLNFEFCIEFELKLNFPGMC